MNYSELKYDDSVKPAHSFVEKIAYNITNPKPIKVFFFIDAFHAGGKERRLVELIKGLKFRPEINFELVVMSDKIHYREIFDLDVKIHYIVRKSKKDLSVFRKVYKLCQKEKPDCVHCWDSMTSIYVIPSVRMLHIKYINGMVVDAPSRQNIFNKNWFRARLAFPHSHMIIGNSKAGLKAYKAPQSKSVCIHNGFNFSRINSIREAEDVKKELQINTRYIVGMVASFSVFKDYRTYFKAAQQILAKRNDITFLAIGEGTDSEEAYSLIEKKYINHFRLVGKKSGVESYINVMNVGVLATFTEGISNSILEYMALAKPVIATDGGGTNELLVDGQTGFLIQSKNPTDLVQKIEILIDNQTLAREMGSAGITRIKEMFSIDKMVEAYISNYQSLVFG
ncbi:MAG TPA: glycosyltransferase [Chitinophagaceae bacterium]|nr:glycosyltransferase [Chitinophagaceae bacterium]